MIRLLLLTGGEALQHARPSIRDALERDAAFFTAAQKQQAVRLVNVLCAYTLHDPELGYCQG